MNSHIPCYSTFASSSDTRAAARAAACNMIWDSLPVEIQTNILEAIVLHQDSARYASTCRAWQTVIERRIFAHLKLTPSRLAGFSDMGYRHRHLVRYIWFSIEPSEYNCPSCGGVGIPNWHHVPAKIIEKAIQDLVLHLSTWEPNGRLSLDISVKAPSGLRHSSSTIQYGPALISKPDRGPKKVKIIQCSNRLHDKDLQMMAAYYYDRCRVIREPQLEPRPSHKMPKARAVTSLLLRRQNRRPWKPEILEKLLALLPEVHEIHYEPWRDWRRIVEGLSNTGKARDTML